MRVKDERRISGQIPGSFLCCVRDESCVEHVTEIYGREPGAVVAALLRCAARQPGGSRLDSGASAAVSASALAAALMQMRRSRPELPSLTAAAVSRLLRYCQLCSDLPATGPAKQTIRTKSIPSLQLGSAAESISPWTTLPTRLHLECGLLRPVSAIGASCLLRFSHSWI